MFSSPFRGAQKTHSLSLSPFANGLGRCVVTNLLGYHDLPPSNNLNHRNAAVSLPLLQRLYALDKDGELVA